MNIEKIRALLGGCGVALALQAGAQDSKPCASSFTQGRLTAAYEQCMAASGTTTAGMRGCIAAEAKLQDARLNEAYAAAMKTLAQARQAKLRDVQRAWIKFRDADCIFLHDPDGGTLAGVTSASCFMQKTAERASELESLLPK